MKEKQIKVSTYTITCAIERNQLTELIALHNKWGIGDLTRENYDWHVEQNLSLHPNAQRNYRWRVKLLDSILTHKLFQKKNRYTGCVSQQLFEVN